MHQHAAAFALCYFQGHPADFRCHHDKPLCSSSKHDVVVASRSRSRIPDRIRTRGYPRITPAPTRKTPETIGPDPGTPAVPPEGPGAVYTQSPTRECPRFALKDPARPA